MTQSAFDTLQYSKKAKEVGFTEQQAEFQAKAMAEVINDKLVTKHDLKHQLNELEYHLTIRIGLMLAASITILAGIIKL